MPAGRGSWPNPRPCWPHLWHSKALAGKVGQGALLILKLILIIRGHLIPHWQYDQNYPPDAGPIRVARIRIWDQKTVWTGENRIIMLYYVIVLAGFVRKIYA